MKTMHRTYRFLLLAFCLPLFMTAGCKGEQKLTQYNQMYKEDPAVLYIAPLNDRAMRRAIRETGDSAYNNSISTAALQLYLTAADPLISRGYYVPGPIASAQIAATESRTGKELRNTDITDLHTNLGIDAVLFIDLIEWSQTHNTWTVEVEYAVRSTHSGGELLYKHVTATKILPTDYKGNPQPLKEDLDFQNQFGCDLETAQRCRLVEILNSFVFQDLPSGSRSRRNGVEPYLVSQPEYYKLRIHKDGSVEVMKSTAD